MPTFAELASARREWNESILKPWCQTAPLKELRLAEQEWEDIAGRVDAASTLWFWAWSRFPQLVHPELPGVNETHEVKIVCRDGSTVQGFPDNRLTFGGRLVLLSCRKPGGREFIESEPISIDDILSVERID